MKFLKSKLGRAALEDFSDPEVEDKANPSSGVDNPEPDAEKEDPAATTAEEPKEGEDPVAADPAVTDTPAAGDDPEAEPAATSDDPAATTDPEADPADAATDAAAAVADTDDAAAAAAATGDTDNIEDPTATDVVEADPEADEVEAEMGEVDKVADQEAEMGEDVEKLSDATESLEVVVAALECAIERGGLDFSGAILARNNVNTVTKSLKVRNLLLPALEEAESTAAKIEGAGNMKDTIVSFIRRIIEQIKSAATRFAAWVVETYKRLTNAYSALEARANKLAEKVNSTEMKTGALENPSLAKALSVAGKPVDDISVYLSNLSQFAKYMNNPGTYKGYLDAIDECEAMLKDPAQEEAARGKVSEKLSAWAKELEKHTLNVTKIMHSQSKTTENGQGFVVPLMGNQVLTVIIPNTAEGIHAMASAVANSGNSAASSVDALDKAKAAKVCSLVAQLAKETRESFEANKGGIKELEAGIKQRRETISAMITALQAKLTEGEEVSARRKVVMFVAKFMASTPKLPVHAVNRALPRDLTTALNYVAASVGTEAAGKAPGTAVATV